MKKRRSFIIITAAVLVFAISAFGTLAYLTNTSAPVQNTFLAAGGGQLIEDDGTFTLHENVAQKQDNGSYTLTSSTTDKNSYDVLPGVDLPKNPTINITKKTTAEAYLFAEIVDELDGTALSYGVTSSWVKLDSVTGVNGGDVYVYSDVQSKPVIVKADVSNLTILNENKIVVADRNDMGIGEDGITLDFYAYLAQANAGTTAAEVYTNCFS